MTDHHQQPKQSIAVIGAGISGLSVAYLLSQQYEVTLFEKNYYFGGHSNTVSIDYQGTPIDVDTGFIVFNHRTYHYLPRLFEHLGITTKKSNMSFAVKVMDDDPINEKSDAKSRLEYSGTLRGLWAQKRNLLNPRYWQMLLDILHFNRRSIAAVEGDLMDDQLSLGDYLKSLSVGNYFKSYYLLPMAGAIWSCPLDLIGDYPAKTFLRFFYNHGLLSVTNQPQWYTVCGGSKQYVSEIIHRLPNCLVSHEVLSVSALSNGVEIISQTNQGKQQRSFDKVIFACHADEALSLINNPSVDQQRLLSAFKFTRNEAILHTDVRQMPISLAAWASWVYISSPNSAQVSLSYWMNHLQNIDPSKPLFVTLNPVSPIREKCIFSRHIYHHPIFDAAAIQAQTQLPSIQGQQQMYFIGAWSRYGFHEDGLRSAIHVAKQLGVSANWAT